MKKDKARDIARGVLPSTRRKGARDDKRNYHAKHRSAQRQVNDAILRHCTVIDDDGALYTDPELYDDFEDLDTFDGYHAATKKPSIGWDDMREIVWSRRNGDKLGPLISWAKATERDKMAGWSIHDKAAYFKAVLPDTLQGRHALGHVEDALDLHTDEFAYGRYRHRSEPHSEDKLRANLRRILSTSKGRIALHEFILETVPVAAHETDSNLKDQISVQARDENGEKRWLPSREWDPVRQCIVNHLTRRPVMVQVLVPRQVATTCDDCSFLRNDPLATTDAVNRFVGLVWSRGRFYSAPWQRNGNVEHSFVEKIFKYIYESA